MLNFWRSRIALLLTFVLLAYPALVACGPTPSSVAPVPTKVAEKPAVPGQTPAAGQPAAAGVKKGGTFVDVSFGDAVTMSPILSSDNASGQRIAFIYPGLLTYDKKLDLVGDLAKSYKISDDKLSLSFELKDNAVWSDGKPVTADDVKFTFDKMMDPKTKYPYRSLWDSFAGLDVTGPKSFVFKLKEVFAPALTTAGGLQPVPKHIFENLDINENEANNKPPVSAGPFLFKEWVKDDHATFVANDKYYNGRPNIDTYIFRVVKDQTVSYQMLKTAEADFSNVLAQDHEDAKKSQVFDTYNYYYYAAPWDYIGFNLKNPILADKRVRQALSYGLDKKKMIERIQLGFARQQYSMYPSTSPVFTDELPKFEFDAAKAKTLLDEAGWKPGGDGIRVKDGQRLKLRVHFNAGNKRRELIATVAQQYWKDIGVEVQVEQEEFGAYLVRVRETHDVDLFILGWIGGYEPNGQSNIWSTGKGQNYTQYSNPQVDELFKKGVTISYDMKERKPVYVEIQKIIAEDQPYIFLWTQENIEGVNKRIKGLDVDPLGLRWNVEKWYSETGK